MDDFPKGESRSVNIGTERKPQWVIQGPMPSAADRLWSEEIAASVCINRLFRIRHHHRDGQDAKKEVTNWISYIRKIRKDYQINDTRKR